MRVSALITFAQRQGEAWLPLFILRRKQKLKQVENNSLKQKNVFKKRKCDAQSMQFFRFRNKIKGGGGCGGGGE